MPSGNPYDNAEWPYPAAYAAPVEVKVSQDVTVELSLPAQVFTDLAIAAAKENVTLNDYIVQVLRDEVSF